jgi:hypothetical protein
VIGCFFKFVEEINFSLNLIKMKKLLVIAGILVSSAAVFTQLCATPGHPFQSFISDAAFRWEQTVFDFGKIKRNVPVTHKFVFTNNGNAPLLITSVQASCGCTVTEYSKDPLPPGAEGFVKATYNAATPGVFSKTVTVNANTPEGHVLLTIKGIVE